jgi:hypothetical protein
VAGARDAPQRILNPILPAWRASQPTCAVQALHLLPLSNLLLSFHPGSSQILKFGQEVDLELLDALSAAGAAGGELRAAVAAQAAGHARELAAWDARIAARTDQLAALTRDNTAALNAVSSLTAAQRGVEAGLGATRKTMFADPVSARRKVGGWVVGWVTYHLLGWMGTRVGSNRCDATLGGGCRNCGEFTEKGHLAGESWPGSMLGTEHAPPCSNQKQKQARDASILTMPERRPAPLSATQAGSGGARRACGAGQCAGGRAGAATRGSGCTEAQGRASVHVTGGRDTIMGLP